MTVRLISEIDVEWEIPVLVIGAGACGLVAALAASESGAQALVIERDKRPSGNTSLSQGLIPAAGTFEQRRKGIKDDPAAFAADIMGKAKGGPDRAIVDMIAHEAGPTVDWLIQTHGVALQLVTDFLYSGHSCHRMHGPPTRTGRDLEGALLNAVERASVDIFTQARAEDVFVDEHGAVRAVSVVRPDGAITYVGCRTLILACNGFGANMDLLRRFAPRAAGLLYVGHPGNDGTALRFGEALGAGTADMNSYQGHGSVVVPENILLTWAVVTEGGFQINAEGNRFGDESVGYSSFAALVEQQPGKTAWSIFDARCEAPALTFDDYQQLLGVGAIKTANTIAELATITGTSPEKLFAVLEGLEAVAAGKARDAFGRKFEKRHLLTPPYRAARTAGALFHTQGGLVVDTDAFVLRKDGSCLANVFAGGGAARGISGQNADGYIAGNGLVSAIVLGRRAGASAARVAGSYTGV